MGQTRRRVRQRMFTMFSKDYELCYVLAQLFWLLRSFVLCGTGLVNANGVVANWTLNDGGTPGNTLGSGAPITDAAGNGHNGTVGGSSTITSVPGVIGTGLNFGNGSTGEYLDVPKVRTSGAATP